MQYTPRNEPTTLGAVNQPPQYDRPEPYEPGTYYTAPLTPPSAPPPKRGMSTGAIVAIVIGCVLVAFCALGAVLVAVAPDPEPAVNTPPAVATTEPPRAAEPTTTSVPETLPPTGPLTSFGDGTYEVGTGPKQVPPGRYTSATPGDSYACYWARLRGLSGSLNDVIANDLGKPGTQVIVQIAPTDVGFQATGCGTWSKA